MSKATPKTMATKAGVSSFMKKMADSKRTWPVPAV
jgi:hypothetical protein